MSLRFLDYLTRDLLDSPDLQERHMARPRKHKPGYVEPRIRPYITTKTAAEMLGFSQSRIKQMIQEGEIKSAYRDGGVWLMRRREVQKIANKR